jgi:ABC-type transport auxiliary lipoprotein component
MRRAGFAQTAACAVAIGVAAGCSMLARKIPETHRYQLVTQPISAQLPSDARIELRAVSGGAPYQDTGLALQTSEYRIDSYRFHRWVAPPTDLVADRVKSIIYAPSPGGPIAPDAPTGVLQADVLAFQQVQNGAQSSGLVDIQFCLYPAGIFQRALWCRDLSKSTPAASDAPEAAAAAINASLNDVLQQFASALPSAIAEIPKTPPGHPGAPAPVL